MAWQCMVVPGSAWQCLVVPGRAWQGLVGPGSAWQWLVVPGSASSACAWKCLVVPSRAWQGMIGPDLIRLGRDNCTLQDQASMSVVQLTLVLFVSYGLYEQLIGLPMDTIHKQTSYRLLSLQQVIQSSYVHTVIHCEHGQHQGILKGELSLYD